MRSVSVCGWAVLPIVGWYLFGVGLLHGQQGDRSQQILREMGERLNALPLQGLKDCGILVENLDDEAIRGGLNERNLQRDVEARLRGIGILVLNANTSSKPYLYVSVLVSRLSGAGYIFALSLELKEQVVPDRDKSLWLSATTWSRMTQSGANQSGLPSKVTQAISVLFDEFRKDYFLVNAH